MTSSTEERRAPNTLDVLRRHPTLRIEHDDYDFNVTATYGHDLTAAEVEASAQTFRGEGEPAHLYFHLPLCNYICHYCNFVKTLTPSGGRGSEVLKEWVGLLLAESNRYLTQFPWVSNACIESIYLGGGTFALLLDEPETFSDFIAHIHSNYSLSPACEITLEGNPDNYTRSKVKLAAQLGFTRYSCGVQTLEDNIQRLSGRGHTARDSFAAIGALGETGKPFNVDMIYGLPLQTVDSFSRDICELVEVGVPTITMYRLRNADRRPLDTGIRAAWTPGPARDRLLPEQSFPRSDDAHRMRDAATQVLLDAGYDPGPACWWSLPGTYEDGIPQVARNKWEQYDTMIAYGPGTYSWLSGGRPKVTQIHNFGSIGQYAKAVRSGSLPIKRGRLLENEQAVGTALGFNFKAWRPLDPKRYQETYGVSILEDEPYARVILELLDAGVIRRAVDDVLIPTLIGEALHEEILSVYFHRRIAGSLASARVDVEPLV
jgi:coproporphyrinogen III oxidase-like Fe-S oxidoreductase